MEFVRRDRAFYGFIAAYACVVVAVAAAVGAPDKFQPLAYLPRWVQCAGVAAAVVTVLVLLRALREPQPFAFLAATARRHWSGELLAGALLFSGLIVFLGVFTSAKTLLPDLAPFWADRILAGWDARLHGSDPWTLLTLLDGATAQIYGVYGTGWFVAITVFALAACVVPAWRAVRAQFVWSFLLCWTLLGNVLAGLFLSGGPIFYGRLLGDTRFDPLVRHLHASIGMTPSYDQILWQAYQADTSGLGRGISAFPSMHVSMATLLMLTAFRLDRRFGVAMLAFLAFVQIGSVHTAWHYAIDGYASFVLTVLVWKMAGAFSVSPAPAGWRLRAAGASPSDA